ncbi:unnamed protein product [Phytophthora lilii]|uniref:Unnamed protein product n=1 Tax=Phytophthora lilii TaxID=2077276 RepID=A0A9W6WXK1_9STRA|nr:unnamed protein product [Phytophthora lilii]
MGLHLVDDDRVLEAALSLVDQHDGGDSGNVESSTGESERCNKKRRASGYNSNRAREAQHRELLALREQVPQLEQRLAELQREIRGRNAAAGGSAVMMDLWKKLAMHELQAREHAEEENGKLRGLVRENADVMTQNLQQLLQTKQEVRVAMPPSRLWWHVFTSMLFVQTIEPSPDPWPYWRMYAVPIDACDRSLFREMAKSIDVVHRQVLQLYCTDADVGEKLDSALLSSTKNAYRRSFADKILPFDVDAVGDAAWQFFAHSFRRPTTRFYYHTDSDKSTGLVGDDTVIEIFGEEHRFGQVMLDIKIKQIVRRYVAAGRVVVAWRVLLSPTKFKTTSLSNVLYEEKGALVIEPYAPAHGGSETASVVHTWQLVTPDMSEAASCGGHDLVLSIGQVVPHEVMGMANFNKNIFVGTGGSEGINFSHFIGAVYGMERMMGRADNPLRRILNYASTNFLQKLPLIYIQTVIGHGENGDLVTRGVFIGDDEECFMKAAELSLEVNFELLDAPLDKVVVYLEPEEFKSTWLGNKSIYRTRMAIADDGELIVLAPGVARFGEDKRIDELIRKYGYRTTPVRLHQLCVAVFLNLTPYCLKTFRVLQEVLAHLNANRDLMKNLSAAAHLIHGSSEGRFRITYCPGHLTKEEVEGVGFGYGDLKEMSAKYPVEKLHDGWNVDANGERFFYISNPALGLWAYRGRFEGSSTPATTSTSTITTATSLSAAADTTEACLDAGVGGGPFKHT